MKVIGDAAEAVMNALNSVPGIKDIRKKDHENSATVFFTDGTQEYKVIIRRN